MKILNPIYDVVFKYLMENNAIAKGLLSVILGVEILSLSVKPQEYTKKDDEKMSVFRIDFKAVIRTKMGEMLTVLIEIQKAKIEKDADETRFRGYLGNAYRTLEEFINAEGVTENRGLPVIAIYFLGYRLKDVKIPFLRVKRTYTNLLTGRSLKPSVKSPFVEQLSHDLIVIQIPRLKKMVKGIIEETMDIFNQTKYRTNDRKVLNYTGTATDPLVNRIIAHLNNGLAESEVLYVLEEEARIAERDAALMAEAGEAKELKTEVKAAKKELKKTKTELTETKTELTETKTELIETNEKLLAESKAREEEHKAREEERKARELLEAQNVLLQKQIAELLERTNNRNSHLEN